jgi:adenylate cyclase
MAIEIERKFLTKADSWRQTAQGKLYRQGYIPTVGKQAVRVRVVEDQGYLTLKGPVVNYSRLEFEYPIPLDDAMQMLDRLCIPPLIEKIRYQIPWGDLVWEVDEFQGDNTGLILAEVELTDPQQAIVLPDWVGKEVTGDPRYYNSYLSKHPFSRWSS